MNCFAQIYIQPTWCPGTVGSESNTIVFPPLSALFPIFDCRFVDSRNGTDIRNCCTFYIHVNPTDSFGSYLQRMVSEGVHYIDSLWEIYRNTKQQYFFTTKTKIIYWLQPRQSRQVVDRAVLTCKVFDLTITIIQEHCLQVLKDNRALLDCVFPKLNFNHWRPVITELFPNSTRKNFLERLENFNTNCGKKAIINLKDLNRNYPTNLYLTQWTLPGYDVEPNYAKMVFPNSTILGPEWYLTFYTVQNPVYLYKHSAAKSYFSPFMTAAAHDSVHFITCAPIFKERGLSLVGYISAFDFPTWTVVFISLLISVLLWNYIIHQANAGPIFAMFLYNIIIGQGTKQVGKARWITGAWVVAAVFLNNGYQGSNIDQLTAPLDPK